MRNIFEFNNKLIKKFKFKLKIFLKIKIKNKIQI